MSFEVNYAAQLRCFLSEYYSRITLITFKKLVFEGIQQEIVLLLGERNGNEQADKSKEVAEREHSEDHPDRVQPDAFTDKLRRQHIAFEKLAEQNDPGDDHDAGPIRSKLRQSDAERQDKCGQ